jgi:zinc transport system substrate-binding protein
MILTRYPLFSARALILLILIFFCVPYSWAIQNKPTVAVSILPQKWFVERIAGELCDVMVLVGPGHSPATYEPTARQMASVQTAIVYISAGVPFENGLLPKLEAMKDVPEVHGVRPEAQHHGHHHHGDSDPHTWLDPQKAEAMADTICANLVKLLPASADYFKMNRMALKDELALMDQEIASILAPCAGATFFVFHPAFGHFAQRYDLIQAAVEVDGHEPSARQMVRIIDEAKAQGAQAIVVQPQFSRKPAEAVAKAIGAEVVALDPLGADYPQTMLSIANGLAKVLNCGQRGKK